MKPIRPHTYSRKKSLFKTSRSAWLSIKAQKKPDYRGIKAAHTKTLWRWILT